MRQSKQFLLAISAITVIGCNEFLSSPMPATTAVDVVGEPRDATPDPYQPADILGSLNSPLPPDDSLANVVDDQTEPPQDSSRPESLNESVEPEVNGGTTTARPVSLKQRTLQPGKSR